MGKAKKRVRVSKRGKKKHSHGQSLNDIEYVLNQAEECMENLDISGAQIMCQRALEINNDHHRALAVTGNMLLEAGQVEEAKQCFGRAIELLPNEGSSKYLNLGQLLEGKEAVECLNKGIELLLNERSSLNMLNKKDKEKYSEFNVKISTAYCATAEVFLTDLCFESNADDMCKAALDKSLEYNSSNPEALQLYASYLLSKNQPNESKDMMKKSLEIWHRSEEFTDENPVDNLLPFPSRVSAAKLLMEHEMHETAIEVLEDLQDEDEEEIETWYLAGCCYNFVLQQITKEEDPETCKDCISDNFSMALKLTVKLKLSEDEMVTDIHKILTELNFDIKEEQFDLKKIEKTFQHEQIRAIIPQNGPSTSKDNEYSFTVSDEEIINDIDCDENEDSSTKPDTDFTDKLSFVYEDEKMQE